MTPKHTLGDAPIEEKYIEQMNLLAHAIDEFFNGDAAGLRETGFVLMVFDMENTDGRCNYISNSNRHDVVVLMKEMIARFEGQPYITGSA